MNRRLDLVDLVRELTQTTQHREMYIRKRTPRYHVTTNPPLLVQLGAASTPTTTGDTGAGASASKPAAALDAIDTMLRIDHEAAAWLRRLGQDDPGNVIHSLTQLGALAASTEHCRRRTPKRETKTRTVTCCDYHRIENDVRCWWSWARIVTRWDQPPWQPHNTCPLCGERGSLRVRYAEKLATCTNCRQTWDDETIGLLADHIRTENGESQAS